MTTPKQKLRLHLVDRHRVRFAFACQLTLVGLEDRHCDDHGLRPWKFDHSHGPPGDRGKQRPEGWYTGEHVCERGRAS